VGCGSVFEDGAVASRWRALRGVFDLYRENKLCCIDWNRFLAGAILSSRSPTVQFSITSSTLIVLFFEFCTVEE
jgi:hypothetical protein